MRYPLNLAGYVVNRVEVETAGLFSGPKLLQNGVPAPKGASRAQFVLRRDDGMETTAQLRTQFLDPVPQVFVDNQLVRLAPPFRWYEWAGVALPFLLIAAGGALGGALGGLAAFVNAQTLRSNLPAPIKVLVCLLTPVVALALFTVVAVALRSGRR